MFGTRYRNQQMMRVRKCVYTDASMNPAGHTPQQLLALRALFFSYDLAFLEPNYTHQTPPYLNSPLSSGYWIFRGCERARYAGGF